MAAASDGSEAEVAYDEKLAARVRRLLAKRPGVREQKMFGGIGFMVGGNMCCGVHGTELILRVAPEDFKAALTDSNARPMDITGRPMKGWLLVSAPGTRTGRDLGRWVDRAVAFASSLPKKARTAPRG
jgi:TfoX/Sxy family transcriptional regulator of competence genes